MVFSIYLYSAMTSDLFWKTIEKMKKYTHPDLSFFPQRMDWWNVFLLSSCRIHESLPPTARLSLLSVKCMRLLLALFFFSARQFDPRPKPPLAFLLHSIFPFRETFSCYSFTCLSFPFSHPLLICMSSMPTFPLLLTPFFPTCPCVWERQIFPLLLFWILVGFVKSQPCL